jgi:Sushi repeat (SCR repeat)
MCVVNVCDLTAVTCPPLEVSNGNVSTSATVYRTQVIIECHLGYRINNVIRQQTVACNETGDWLPSNVSCLGVLDMNVLS